MPDPRQIVARPRFGGVVARVGAVGLVVALTACSNGSSSEPRVSTTKGGQTTTTVADGVADFPDGVFDTSWKREDADPNESDTLRAERCPEFVKAFDRTTPTDRARLVFTQTAAALPVVVIDSWRFDSVSAAREALQSFASVTFTDCLRTTFSAGALALQNLVVEGLPTTVQGPAEFGYRVRGLSGDAPKVEHVIVEIAVVARAEQISVVTFSTTLRFPLDSSVRSDVIAALADL